MDVVRDIAELRGTLDPVRHRVIGLVPTMGNLHAGHVSLVRACTLACDVSVVSIFVNPTQFGPNEDFASYPRTLTDDLRLLAHNGADVVFEPPVDVMYPEGRENHVTIAVPSLAHTLCGAARPGHFDGVATVVAKLFNIVTPDKAFFGEKDWQQLTLIRTMVRQLDMPVVVEGVPTVRETSGLAMSSRNNYLSDEERQRAALINRVLTGMKKAVEQGEKDYASAEARGHRVLTEAGFDVDYVAVRDAERLVVPDADTRTLRILAAARLGGARLIDNVGVEMP
ncbi:MAG: pantoate--beta-alanine ligase [Gammaproteobacteria bacterium]|nr:pantoate--beta-alanine ligase [Gammaproteobacteria bacterium]